MDNDKPLGFGVIGAGFGVSRCPLIQKTPGASLLAICSRTEERAKAAGELLGVDWFTDYRRLLDNPDIDVIGLYTPSGSHCEIAIEAAKAGKHLILTKPPEINLERMDAMLSACDAAGVRMAVEFVVRHETGNFNLYKAIRDGLLGRMRLGEYAEKLHRLAGYFRSDGGWRALPDVAGGGVLMNQGIHQLDQMVWMLGRVKSLKAFSVQGTENPATEDTVAAVLDFESGAVGVLIATTTFMSDKPSTRYGGATVRRIEVNGEEGSATVIDGKAVMWKSKTGKPFVEQQPAPSIFPDMVAWVRDPGHVAPLMATGADARYLLAVIEAIYRSARMGGEHVETL